MAAGCRWRRLAGNTSARRHALSLSSKDLIAPLATLVPVLRIVGYKTAQGVVALA
jgi:hypothetical protein